MPKTKAGRWSVGLLAGSVVLLIIFFIIVSTGQRGGDAFFDNLYLTIPFVLSVICGVLSFIVGLYAIAKYRERSVMVYITVFVGFLMTLYIAAEIIFPH